MKAPSRTPSTYIALLRGINVGGHKIIKMDQLRKAFEELGFEDVATYVQSGNVVFKSPKKTSADLSRKIEEMLLRRFSMSVPVIVRTAEEIGEVLTNNPFLKERGIDVSQVARYFSLAYSTEDSYKGTGCNCGWSGPVSLPWSGNISPLPEWFWRDQAIHQCVREGACRGRDYAQLEHGKQALRDGAGLAAACKNGSTKPAKS